MQYSYLYHHGILGQKWGVRRFQNEDGSLTPAGRERYGLKPDYTFNEQSVEGKRAKEALLKGFEKNILENKETRFFDYHKNLNSAYADKSIKDLVDDYKNEYIKDIEKQLPDNLGRIDKDALLENLASKAVERAFFDAVDKNSHFILEEKIKSDPKTSGQTYVEYEQSLWSEDDSSVMTDGLYDPKKAHDIYMKNNGMSNPERKTFDLLESNLHKLSIEERDDKLREVSIDMDASGRDDPSVLVYDPKKNKIVAYPFFNAFVNSNNKWYKPDYSKLLEEAKKENLWVYCWGENALDQINEYYERWGN